jgi:hypothetical protein
MDGKLMKLVPNLVVQWVKKTKMRFARDADQEATVAVKELDRKTAKLFVDEMAKYPPLTAGNKPPTPYWERGKGRVTAKPGYNPPSQRLTQSWVTREEADSAFAVYTNVTYAPYVVGDKAGPKPHQASFHSDNGWRDTQEVLDQIKSGGTYAGYQKDAQNKIVAILRKWLS